MPTLYWGPWLARIHRGGPDTYSTYKFAMNVVSQNSQLTVLINSSLH